MSQLNQEKLKECVEADFDELTEEILTVEATIQSVINPTAPKDVDSDENGVYETNSISWNKAADALNILIKFS